MRVKKTAFTLAEVLITLGIIGVVAAMTLPTLIQNNRNTVAETRLKKFYTTMNQAILLSEKDNGPKEYWDYWVTDKKDDDGNYINQNGAINNSFEKYLAPYLKITNVKEVYDIMEGGGPSTLYFLADGSAFTFHGHENRDLLFFPDKAEKCLSSAKKVRVSGRCSFTFSFYPIEKSGFWQYHYRKGLEPHLFGWNGQEQSLYNDSSRGCHDTGIYCTAIIQRNGWRIPKDYPFKISY